jgi:spermidine synthase
MKQKWYIDKYLPHVHVRHRIKKILFRKKTKFQNIQIFDLFDCGKSLVIDGIPQNAEKDEWIYHECLIHPALILQPVNKKLEILVLGAGEGATLRELLKYKNVKTITAVDIDQEAVEIFKKFFPKIHQDLFNNPKVNLVIDSAENFLKNTVKKYDLIFSDITDVSFFNLDSKIKKSNSDFYSIGKSKVSENIQYAEDRFYSIGNLKTPDNTQYTEGIFYKLIYQKLKKNSLFVMHTCDFSEIDYKKHFQLKRILSKIFPQVYSYRTYVSFFNDYWGFLIASPNLKFNPLKISEKTIKNKIKQQNLEKKLKYFSPEIYKAIFSLPPFLKKIESGKYIS